MPLLKNFITNFKSLNTSRKFSIFIFFCFIITAQITAVFITIGILNFSQLISHINIPSGYIYLDIDIDSPDTMTVQIPYEIINPGIYELTDITIKTDIHVNFINQSNHVNITLHIFSKKSNLGNCKPLQNVNRQIKGDFYDFFIPSLSLFLDNADESEFVNFLIDIQFSAKYMFRLIQFQFAEYNLSLFNF